MRHSKPGYCTYLLFTFWLQHACLPPFYMKIILVDTAVVKWIHSSILLWSNGLIHQFLSCSRSFKRSMLLDNLILVVAVICFSTFQLNEARKGHLFGQWTRILNEKLIKTLVHWLKYQTLPAGDLSLAWPPINFVVRPTGSLSIWIYPSSQKQMVTKLCDGCSWLQGAAMDQFSKYRMPNLLGGSTLPWSMNISTQNIKVKCKHNRVNHRYDPSI
jgi:hypothetical protein